MSAEDALARRALERIAAPAECAHFTGPPYCRDEASGRDIESPYTATGWCDICIARAALAKLDAAAALSSSASHPEPDAVSRLQELIKWAGRYITRHSFNAEDAEQAEEMAALWLEVRALVESPQDKETDR